MSTVIAPLPSPFATAEVGAYMRHGCRELIFTLVGPSSLYRNAYGRAWITVSEVTAMRGEPLRLTTERYLPDTTHGRQSFTTAGRRQLEKVLLPALAAGRFADIWAAHHRAASDVERYAKSAAHAAAIASWWTLRREVAEMYSEGLLDIIEVRQDPHARPITIGTVGYDHRFTWSHVIARVHADGEPIGWMTTDGCIIPDDDLIKNI